MATKKPTPRANTVIEKQSEKFKPASPSSKPGKGGKRPGAGRPPGSVSPEKKALRELAQVHTEDAVQALAKLCSDENQPGMVRVSAACALLDRGHGKPATSVTIESSTTSTVNPAALIALSEAMERSRTERRAIMERRKQLGFTGD